MGQVDACQQRLEKLPILLKRFRQSVLTAACSGRLTVDWRKEPIESDSIPLGWESRQLDSLFTIRTGGTPSRKVSEYFLNGTIPWVKTGEVQNCDILATEEYITQAAVKNSNAKIFPAGAILVAMYGEGKTRGQIGRLTFPAATNQACAALINAELPRQTSQYIFNFLLSQYFRLRMESFGGNQPNLNLSVIKRWKVPLPPLAEQQEIVRRVESLFALADQLEQRLAQARRQVIRLNWRG
jgi:type I restriction enzyme S subunit